MNPISTLDKFSAFIQYLNPYLRGENNKLLSNLTFGVKDIFDIAGYPTAFGSPDWLNSHPVPTETSSSILSLIQNGATLVGKTHTDELTYSILGVNAHYGTPINPISPNRVPGGSSSGSAVAVAGQLVDFAIGSDTGGSVRTPASFCGIYGIRPTHGRISLDHARPLAKSFDTLGWFARDPKILDAVGKVLLANQSLTSVTDYEFIVPEQAWSLIPNDLRNRCALKIKEIFSDYRVINSDIPSFDLSSWAQTFRTIQAYEIWQEHGQWASNHMENFGPGIKDRFLFASKVTSESVSKAIEARQEIQNLLNSLLIKKFFIIPTVSNFAPLLDSTQAEFEEFRQKCIAGLGGLPQITIPLASTNDGAFGISLVGAKDSDLVLLNLVKQLF
mgnify:CR=1 FL=1